MIYLWKSVQISILLRYQKSRLQSWSDHKLRLPRCLQDYRIYQSGAREEAFVEESDSKWSEFPKGSWWPYNVCEQGYRESRRRTHEWPKAPGAESKYCIPFSALPRVRDACKESWRYSPSCSLRQPELLAAFLVIHSASRFENKYR